MAVSDGESVTVVKDMGLVMTVFDERTVSALPGDLAIGHTRYSTTGRSEWRNAQPVFRSVGRSGFALGHNGNLTNTADLASRSGMLPGVVASDSDLIAEVVAAAWGRGPSGPDSETSDAETSDAVLLEEALTAVLPSVEGAYSIVAITATAVMGARDPNGFRPLPRPHAVQGP
jgi:amidophosphoribosyltransferase